MNLLTLSAFSLAGLAAGYISWMSMRSSDPWGFGEAFLGTLLTTGVFSASLLALSAVFLSLGNEMRYSKAMRLFSSHAAVGLAIPMTAAVIYSLIFDLSGLANRLPTLLTRSLWWLFLAFSIALARGIIMKSCRSCISAIMGLGPGILLTGTLIDRIFLPNGYWLIGSLIMGGVSGFCMGLSIEMLKTAWLELAVPVPLKPQYILETEEFTAGSGDHCDMTLRGGPEHRFVILERDNVHYLEVISGEPVTVGHARFRYRVLSDGDTIILNGGTWVYRTTISRIRDVVPEVAV